MKAAVVGLITSLVAIFVIISMFVGCNEAPTSAVLIDVPGPAAKPTMELGFETTIVGCENTGAPATVSIGTRSGWLGEEVNIPVYMNTHAEGLPLLSFRVDIEYPADLLRWTGTSPGDLALGIDHWSVAIHPSEPLVRFQAMEFGQDRIPNDTSGVLAWMHFEIIGKGSGAVKFDDLGRGVWDYEGCGERHAARPTREWGAPLGLSVPTCLPTNYGEVGMRASGRMIEVGDTFEVDLVMRTEDIVSSCLIDVSYDPEMVRLENVVFHDPVKEWYFVGWAEHPTYPVFRTMFVDAYGAFVEANTQVDLWTATFTALREGQSEMKINDLGEDLSQYGFSCGASDYCTNPGCGSANFLSFRTASFPVQVAGCASGQPGTIGIGSVMSPVGDKVLVPITIWTSSRVDAFMIDLLFPSSLEFRGLYDTGALADPFEFLTATTFPGGVRIVAAGGVATIPPGSSGDLITLGFKVSGDVDGSFSFLNLYDDVASYKMSCK